MLQVNEELCIGCGICEESCPFAAIVISDGLPVIGDNCTLCGACVESCEVGALSIEVQDKNDLDDLTRWSGVWVFGEYRNGQLAPVTLELLGIGRQLADTRGVLLAALLIGSDTGDAAEKLIGHGADLVYLADNPTLQDFHEDSYSAVAAAAIRAYRPEI
ncbi:MAG TPA: 4Fe-4S binding protein, partial [Desulforhopalus sp.]|nr:4Fe-4S binding protein [Desulforhopalus sp.]